MWEKQGITQPGTYPYRLRRLLLLQLLPRCLVPTVHQDERVADACCAANAPDEPYPRRGSRTAMCLWRSTVAPAIPAASNKRTSRHCIGCSIPVKTYTARIDIQSVHFS